jgi:hypothetical protein
MGESVGDLREPQEGMLLVRADGPGARRIFTDTPIVSPKRWAVLQAKRVKTD